MDCVPLYSRRDFRLFRKEFGEAFGTELSNSDQTASAAITQVPFMVIAFRGLKEADRHRCEVTVSRNSTLSSPFPCVTVLCQRSGLRKRGRQD